MKQAGWVVTLAAFAGACGGQNPDEAAWVVTERSAREAGWAFEVDGTLQSGVLPVEVAAGSRVSLVGGEELTEIELAPGEVVVARTELGVLDRMLLGADVEPDAVAVLGSERAAELLAREVGGTFEPMGSGFKVGALDGFRLLAAVEAPSGLLEVLPLRVPGGVAGAGGDGVTDDEAEAAAVASLPSGDQPFALAGLDPTHLFGAPRKCGDLTGTWRGQQFAQHKPAWYRFTLRVERVQPGSATLVGRIDVESWYGDELASTPPVGDTFAHFTVRMNAEGRVHADGKVEFSGVDWALTRKIRGWAPTERGHYCEDRFTGAVGADGLLRAENDDRCNPTDPVVFTQIACGS